MQSGAASSDLLSQISWRGTPPSMKGEITHLVWRLPLTSYNCYTVKNVHETGVFVYSEFTTYIGPVQVYIIGKKMLSKISLHFKCKNVMLCSAAAWLNFLKYQRDYLLETPIWIISYYRCSGNCWHTCKVKGTLTYYLNFGKYPKNSTFNMLQRLCDMMF